MLTRARTHHIRHYKYVHISMDWNIAIPSLFPRSNMKISYLVLFLFPLCVSTAVYDHLMLVLDWPNGYCSSRNCLYSPLPQEFGIHGIWPVTKDGKDILDCNPSGNISLFFEKYPRLEERVLTNWPSLSVSKDDNAGHRRFWNHEWTKHGSCQSVMTAKQYFDRGVKLSNKVNLLKALADQKMSPGETYSKSQYTDAIQAKIGKLSVAFRCWKKYNVELLQEVIICVDKSAQHFIGCDKALDRDNCRTNAIKLAARVELPQEAAEYKNMEL